MTELVNKININSEPTSFLNYIAPVVPTGEPITRAAAFLNSLFTEQFGATSTIWTNDNSTRYSIKFPVAWETIGTGSVGSTLGGGIYYPNNNTRIVLHTDGIAQRVNTSRTTTVQYMASVSNTTLAYNQYSFAVVNNYSIAIAYFNNSTKSLSSFLYAGWLKGSGSGGNYTGLQYPRNFVSLSSAVFSSNPWGTNLMVRVAIENGTTNQPVLTTQPALSCAVSTPGADSSDVVFQDSTAPNNYIGKFWNIIKMPSSAVVGKIYKNTGIDPDTGNIETDQKAFWLCVGVWGTFKIGMRAWTENIT